MKLIWLGFAVFIVWITVRAMNREKASRDRTRSATAAVAAAYGITDVFVSPEDGGLIGLSADGERLVLGRGDEHRTAPTTALRAVEGVRDGAVLVRAEPGGDPVAAPAEQSVADLPDRIGSLELRLTLDDGVHIVRFFDGGRHGVSPINEHFRRQAAQAEAWFRKLSNAMRMAR